MTKNPKATSLRNSNNRSNLSSGLRITYCFTTVRDGGWAFRDALMSNLLGSSIFFIVLLILISSCKKSSSDPNPITTAPVDTTWSVFYYLTDLEKATSFEASVNLGSIQNTSLQEISGIAGSYLTKDAYWVEQDSGNPNAIYLFDKGGVQLGSAELTYQANRDWEDIATGPGPKSGVNYIYLAEIGDNKARYPTKYIYRFAEPSISASTPNVKVTTVDIISFHFPDATKNAETVMVDPLTKDIYVISKEDAATLYVAKYPQDLAKEFALVKIGVLPISTVTAGDISPDGTEVLIKNYSTIYYWKKSGNETIGQLMKKKPILLPYSVEPQGEAICWGVDGSGYYTTSEIIDTTPASISFYKRK